MSLNFLNSRFTFSLFILTYFFILSPSIASEKIVEKETPNIRPVFEIPESIQLFIKNLSMAEWDKTRKRLIFNFNGVLWFITSEYRDRIVQSGIHNKTTPWIFKIEYKGSEEAESITRYFYCAHFCSGYSEKIDLLEFRISHLSQ